MVGGGSFSKCVGFLRGAPLCGVSPGCPVVWGFSGVPRCVGFLRGAPLCGVSPGCPVV